MRSVLNYDRVQSRLLWRFGTSPSKGASYTEFLNSIKIRAHCLYPQSISMMSINVSMLRFKEIDLDQWVRTFSSCVTPVIAKMINIQLYSSNPFINWSHPKTNYNCNWEYSLFLASLRMLAPLASIKYHRLCSK